MKLIGQYFLSLIPRALKWSEDWRDTWYKNSHSASLSVAPLGSVAFLPVVTGVKHCRGLSVVVLSAATVLFVARLLLGLHVVVGPRPVHQPKSIAQCFDTRHWKHIYLWLFLLQITKVLWERSVRYIEVRITKWCIPLTYFLSNCNMVSLVPGTIQHNLARKLISITVHSPISKSL